MYPRLIQLSNLLGAPADKNQRAERNTQTGKKRDKRGRLQECSGAPSDGVM